MKVEESVKTKTRAVHRRGVRAVFLDKSYLLLFAYILQRKLHHNLFWAIKVSFKAVTGASGFYQTPTCCGILDAVKVRMQKVSKLFDVPP